MIDKSEAEWYLISKPSGRGNPYQRIKEFDHLILTLYQFYFAYSGIGLFFDMMRQLF
jgi:hypothetical protein